jgi:hypothetical protein
MTHRILMTCAAAAALTLASVAWAQPQQAPDPRQACAADFQKLCPDAKPGPGGGLRECVTAHFNELSDPCKQAIMAMRQQMQQQQQAPATNSPAH